MSWWPRARQKFRNIAQFYTEGSSMAHRERWSSASRRREMRGSAGGMRMSTELRRLRAYMQFIAAVLYFFLARALARHGALGLASEQWSPLVEQAMLVFLLLLGYAGMGFWLDRQTHPVSAQGLPRRQGWPGEAGLGLAVGWALAVVCVLPMVVGGGIAIVLVLRPSAWGWLVADAAFFALAALAEEVAFRGYGFQRFAHAVGPLGAALGFAAFYAIVQALCRGRATPALPFPWC